MRCNTGINPVHLADQHLIAEYRELPMVIGSLRYNDWRIKTPIPNKLSLGKGHLNFWKDKLLYLRHRHNYIKKEMIVRGFKCDALTIDLSYIDSIFCHDWKPEYEDSKILRNRIIEKFEMKPLWYRYYRNPISDPEEFKTNILDGELFNC